MRWCLEKGCVLGWTPSIEFGSGVGLTGLVVGVLCLPSCVSHTNFTNACLTNLFHNAKVVNQDFLEGQGVVTGRGRGADGGESSQGPLSMPPFLNYDALCLCVSPALRPAAKISLLCPFIRSRFEPPPPTFFGFFK